MNLSRLLLITVAVLALPAGAASLCEEGDTSGACDAVSLIDMRLVSEEEQEEEGRPYRPGSFSRKVYERSDGGISGDLPKLDLEMTTRLVPGQADPLTCEIDGSLSYLQLGDAVEVSAVIENRDCGASGGRYRIRVIARDEAGERISDTYNESWSRLGDDTVEVTHNYPLVPESMLVRVSLRPVGAGCRCSALDAVLE